MNIAELLIITHTLGGVILVYIAFKAYFRTKKRSLGVLAFGLTMAMLSHTLVNAILFYFSYDNLLIEIIGESFEILGIILILVAIRMIKDDE